ncbi:MAG TPA: SAM-dependent methyltransferase [Streptosporangiaceae bacterium]|jgi:SAM-dependent methyltransferase
MPAREPRVPDGVDVTIPSVARIYDYLLGGKDNYAADREAAAKFIELVPEVRQIARANRDFLVRCVRFLAQAGVEQFIELGAGIPTHPSVHEIARQDRPDARVAYVDHDPVVLAHNRALLATDDGVIIVKADLREPDQVLGDPALSRLIDFSQPIAVLFLAVLHFISDEEGPGQIVAGFRDRLSPGGYLVISTGSSDGADASAGGVQELYRAAGTPIVGRSPEQVMEFFAGCDLVEPGLVQLSQWRPDLGTDTRTTRIHMLAGVGRKR